MTYLSKAKDIAREAGLLIRKSFGVRDFNIQGKTSDFDIVTEVDYVTEKLIRNRITELFPEHDFLGEEEVFKDKDIYKEKMKNMNNLPYLWVIDPIDGTNNFSQGIPGFVVSIALICYGKINVAVIYDPIRDEMFWAESGKGAYMNGESIHTSRVKTLNQSVVGTSLSSTKSIRAQTIKSVQQVAFTTRAVRILGSAALNLVYVAIGRLTAYWHYDLNIWDVVAGVLIIQEAGGQVTHIDGKPYQYSDKSILASNSLVHQLLKSKINN